MERGQENAGNRRRLVFWIWLMMVVAYLDRINITIAGPTVMKSLHLSPSQFGYVLSAFTLGYALMQIPGGYLADRLGARPLLVTALVFWSIFTGLTGTATSLAVLILIRVLFGVGEGLENGAQFKLIADHFNPRQRSSANATFLTALALGPALASPAASWLLGRVGWRGLFFSFAVPGVIVAVLLALFLPRSTPVRDSETVEGAQGADWERILQQAGAWLRFGAYLLFNMAFWGFIGWMPTYLNLTRHIELKSLGWLASIPYLCGFAGMLVMGYLGSRSLARYRAALVGVGYLLAGGFLYVAFSATTAAGSLTGLSLSAFFLYGGFGPFWAIALDEIPAEVRGGFSGFVNFGGQVGGFFAPMVVGRLVESTHSFTPGFLFMMGALALAACCMFGLQRDLTRNS